MAVLALLALALFAGTAFAAPSDTARIEGGWPTTIEKYPGIVQVENRNRISGIWFQACAANILNNIYVLSSASCFTRLIGNGVVRPETRRIRAGSTMLNSGGVIVNVEQAFNHPSYSGRLNDFDGNIAVVRLASPLVYSPVVQPVNIPRQGSVIPDDVAVRFVGWGEIDGLEDSTELSETSVFTINHEVCVARYARESVVITENLICAEYPGEFRGPCPGDQGGPLYYDHPESGDVVIGVISSPISCANTLPHASVAVSSYTDWIVQTAV